MAIGLDRFDAAVSRAMLLLKQDNKLRAAVKLRQELAYQMALRSTGCEDVRHMSLCGHYFGTPTQEMQDIIDSYLNSVEVETT
jgi:hypothetical protein